MIDPVPIFGELFRGRTDAYGIDKGGVARVDAREDSGMWHERYRAHLDGEVALGIFPMLDSAHVWFGAIDLDEPNFELAGLMQRLLPGVSWIEESRSGNAHVWVFFTKPAPAWAVRAILRGATEAVDRNDVEIFPKQDGLKPGMVGNYINLPLYGDQRPITRPTQYASTLVGPAATLKIMHETRQDPAAWERRARNAGAKPPAEREATQEFGTRANLHECAAYIIERRESHPLERGHRHQVLWHLAKMLLNWREFSSAEAREWVDAVNEAGEAPLPSIEVDRLFENAERGQWTSTGCDDPVMAPYVRPDCPILRGSR